MATTTTDANGAYRFDVEAGQYIVEFAQRTGFQFAQQDAVNDTATDSDVGANGRTAVIDLQAGTTYTDIDASMQAVAANDELSYTTGSQMGVIRGRMTLDANGDNTESNGAGGWEAGVAGQKVQLLDTRGNIIAETVTAANGFYRFDVWPGDYVVKFASRDGYKFAEFDRGDNAAADSDAFATGLTDVIRVGAGSEYTNIDASVQQVAANNELTSTNGGAQGSIGGRLTWDSNGDDTEANGYGGWDIGLAGRTVQLLDIFGNVVAETTTGSRGDYRFDVDPGQYIVKFPLISGFEFSRKDVGPTNADSDADAHGLTSVIDVKAGQVYYDIEAGIRYTGETSGGEEAPAGTTTYDSNGFSYTQITNIDPDLAVRSLGTELIVNGGFENHANAGKANVWLYTSLQGWDLAGDASYFEIQTADFNTGNTPGNSILELDVLRGVQEGISQTFTASASGTYQISFDYGVRNHNFDGQPWWYASASNGMNVYVDGQLVQMVGSGVDGNYRGFQTRTFDLDLTAGTHTIKFVEDGFYRSLTDDGIGAELDNVSVRQVTLVQDTGTLSGTFYFDGDRDGVRDANEAGLGGREVWLLDQNGQKISSDGSFVKTVTDADGNYSFTGLDAGNYRVGFVDDFRNLEFTDPDSTNANGQAVKYSDVASVTAGVETGNVDTGMVGLTTERTIEVCENDSFVADFDTVCQLMSEDVYFMVGEPVCARLGRTSFDEAQTQSWNNSTTTAVPYYVFLDEPSDTDLTFTVRLTVDPDRVQIGGSGYAPDGFAYLTNQANEIGAPRFEEITVTVRAGQTRSDAFFVGTEAARLNYAFGIEIESVFNNDLNEECALVSRVVTTPVAIDLNGDGRIGVTGDTTSADKSGLTIGQTVKFDMDADGVAERIEWFDGSGDGILIDNRDGGAFSDMDGSRLFGDDNGRYSDGYAKLRAEFDSNGDGRISGAELNGLMLWVDDGDAKVEAGELRTLQSYSITEISGLVSTTTDASGRELIRSTVTQNFETSGTVTYRLEGPDAALFTVNAQGEVNFINAPDYENPLDQGRDNVYNVTLIRETDDPNCKPARENLRIEVCDKPSLGDTVWYDTNRDGMLNNGEQGAAGVTVNLIQAGVVVASMVTDANGQYLFDDLMPGDYQVQFVAPSGYTFTSQSPTNPEAVNNDSDAGDDGLTGVINLVIGEHQRNVDAGLVLENTPPSAGDDHAKTCADVPVTVDVLANDSDPDGDSLTITAVGGQAISEGDTVQVDGVNVTLTGGQLVIDGEDAFAFLDIGEQASQNIDYTVSDGNGGTASATVDVTFCGDANSVDSLAASMPNAGSYQVVSGARQYPTSDIGYDLRIDGTGDQRLDGVVFEQAYCLSFFEPADAADSFANATVLPGALYGAATAGAANVFNASQVSNFNGQEASENLDLINWILAQNFEDDATGSVDGGFSGWEVQFAIWELTDDFDADAAMAGNPAFGNIADTDYILAQAAAYGEGFTPGVGDTIGLIVDPNPASHDNSQPFIVALDYESIDCLC